MTEDVVDLPRKAEQLRELHQGDLLVLPNVWDAASATVVATSGGRAVATASAAISAMLGYPDGEGAPWSEMFDAAARVARAVSVPVTVDAEAGYGMRPRELVDRLIEAGAAGCNLEDSDHRSGGLQDADTHADWLAEVRLAAAEAGVPLVLNARIDTYLSTSGLPDGQRIPETVRRGRLYRAAGADCLYPIAVSRAEDLAILVRELPGPINGNTSEHLDLATLRKLGVARVSYGPRFYRAALADFGTAVRDIFA